METWQFARLDPVCPCQLFIAYGDSISRWLRLICILQLVLKDSSNKLPRSPIH